MSSCAQLLDHIGFHREVLGEPEPVELRGRALVARFDTLPELALVVAAGKGRRSFCDWCLKIAWILRRSSSCESGTS